MLINRSTVSRTTALVMAGALLTLACGGSSGSTTGTAPKGTKKVGHSTSLSGSIASYGAAGVSGLQMAMDEVNAKGGVNGYKIELDPLDDQAKADVGTENARRLIEEDKVVALFGSVSSAVCLAESPIAKQFKVPFLTFMCNTVNLSTKNYEPYFSSVIPNTFMEGTAIGIDMAGQSKYKNYYVLAPDYEFGHVEADAFKKALAANNPSAKIIGEEYPKLGTTDFTPFITKILAANPKPDVVYSNIYSGDLVTFIKQAKPYDFFNKVTFATLTATDDLQTLGADFPINLRGYSRAPFYAIDTPANKDFVKRYKDKTGKYPSEWAILGYDAFNMWAAAANKAGTFSGEKVIANLEGKSFDSLRGKLTIRKLDHQGDASEWVGTTAKTPDYPFPIFTDIKVYSGAKLLMPEEDVKKLQPA